MGLQGGNGANQRTDDSSSGFRRLPTKLDDVALIEPVVHGDERGFLLESFRADALADLGVDATFVQENHTRSRGDVVRGLHIQRGQSKLIRCVRGRIWDVVVDLRPGSDSFRIWEAHQLDDEKHRQLFVPPGFAHGFCALSDEADVVYLVSSYYDPELENGIAWDDPDIGIEWPVQDPVLSDRDRAAPRLHELGAEAPADLPN